MSRQVQGYLYLALAMLTVGSTVIASKLIASGLPPFSATALRFAIAFPVFLVLMRATEARLPKLSRHDGLILIIQAGAGSVGYTTLLISGLSLTSAADAGVIIGTLPVVSAAISILLLGERPQRGLLFAVALATAGVLSIAFSPEAAGGSLSGNALIFLAVVCEGLFILLNKRLKTEIAPLAQSTLMTGIGFLVADIPAIFEAPLAQGISGSAVAAVVYYALVPTVGGFLLWYAGAERVSGTEAALFTALAPVSAVMLAFIILGEPVGLNQIAGIACVLAAVLGLALAGRRAAMKATSGG
ncbi:drug/metabolite transporter (DMT)-like permease [Rhizobium leguminosarum]|uniref:Drug/metabolite transporter (DMT)-like permease n=1 Tax=Rhizobium leguminosarum TaxID=384 RepID=A0AAE2MLB8_RHILE|nr:MULTISPECIES: DMT family transporter [Rhizobium]MBB4291255.1 drug/metabolite transporter (DMT)-like permease [Rhizobium leguminosarum]MBB4297649.1 drug/metabolite transporter (DMT)-like permease [Rhizobium leguminosarum]MBB4308789.1 drug/metabolite transporter (DMT)-like permease [Rhizobium leguminosarum]MBB4416624.1 drug/metabolite transporter (DMT)-like permease [Rhizobium leguminosarum]MBB4430408.1 drug/metabolite transporter (DMT)-like permease [Rhizobium esperanzae]